MNEIKLSIVIPVYNAAAYLPGLLDMLAGQTDSRFEAVMVNDGSTDNSIELLRAEEKYGRFYINVIDQPNAGVSAARNAGIKAAKADYLTFIDADDVITTEFVEHRISNAGCDVCVYPHARAVSEKAVFDNSGTSAEELTGEEMLRRLLAEPTRFAVYDLVLKREFLVKTGLAFAEGWKYYEDYDFILHLFSLNDKVKCAEQCDYCYRAAAGSAMNIFNTERLLCLQLFDNEHSLYLKNRPEFRADFLKWFSARIKWSVMWQACVAMSLREALTFGKVHGMRAAMRSLLDYPDKRVALSAAAYLVCPGLYAMIIRRMGRRRTLIPADSEK